MAAVRRGDDRAFEQLYSRYGERISAYIHGMVGDHGRAEDITQDVFISALRRMRDSDRPIAFKPWIYEIAKNACIDDFRRTRRAREVPISGDDGELEHSNPRLIGRTQTPDAAIESRQHLTDLRGAFRGLSESHHQIIVLRELEGLSYAEIGKRMGMTRPVVESTLFRARRRLSDEYDELVSGRRCTHVQAVITDRGPRAFRALGIKERRLVARHLAHCQPCRRHAHLHGFDSSVMQPPTVIGKIAALLPIPAFLRFRRGGGSGAGSRAGRAIAAARSHAFNALQSTQSVTASLDPSAPAGGISRVAAAAAAATLAIAGAGGGILAATSSSTPHRTPAIVRAGAGGASAARAGHAATVAGSKGLTASARSTRATARQGAGAVSGTASHRGGAAGSGTSAGGLGTGHGGSASAASAHWRNEYVDRTRRERGRFGHGRCLFDRQRRAQRRAEGERPQGEPALGAAGAPAEGDAAAAPGYRQRVHGHRSRPDEHGPEGPAPARAAPVGSWHTGSHRGVAQPGSAHRSGR